MCTTTTTMTTRAPQNQDAAQLHMSKLNGFRLPADNKNGCFHIKNKLYASLMLLRFTSISAPESTRSLSLSTSHTPASYRIITFFYVKISLNMDL